MQGKIVRVDSSTRGPDPVHSWNFSTPSFALYNLVCQPPNASYSSKVLIAYIKFGRNLRKEPNFYNNQSEEQ